MFSYPKEGLRTLMLCLLLHIKPKPRVIDVLHSHPYNSVWTGDRTVELEVVRKLLNLWMKGALNYRISSKCVTKMSKLLVAMKSAIPSEFVRKPRGLDEGYRIVAIITLYRPCSLDPVLLLPI